MQFGNFLSLFVGVPDEDAKTGTGHYSNQFIWNTDGQSFKPITAQSNNGVMTTPTGYKQALQYAVVLSQRITKHNSENPAHRWAPSYQAHACPRSQSLRNHSQSFRILLSSH
eukprot:scaffold44623_cov59-Attheya_sp.AAC.1